jgi:putative toxin-antitoxin system antitoxin component (TIGR02293 family)
LPVCTLEALATNSGLSVAEIAAQLGIPARTLARRRSEGRLSFEESERTLRLAMIFEQTRSLFDGNAQGALEWLQTPKRALSGARPLDYAATELGAREVEDLIGRLEHGVFS